jgi:predicted PurR-regulated permease PerM
MQKIFSKNWLWILGTLALAGLVYYFSDIVTYFLLAWVLSLLGRPPMVFIMRYGRIGRFRIGQSGAALLTILLFFGVLTGLLFLFVPTIVAQARHLASVDYQVLGEKLRVPFASLDAQLHQLGLLKINESLAIKVQEISGDWIKPTLLGDFLGSFLGVAGNLVLTITATTFILFFFLQDSRMFEEILHALVPNDLEPKVRHALDDSSALLTRYFGGLLIQMGAFATMITGLLLIMGAPNALLIGAFGGLLNVVPYLGPILGQIFGCFIMLSFGIELEFALLWPMLAKVVIAFAVTQFIDNNILMPTIFSNSVKAHPLEIFIVTLMAAKLGGVLGMVIGIPVYTVLRVIARVFFSEFKVVQRWTEQMDTEPDKPISNPD